MSSLSSPDTSTSLSAAAAADARRAAPLASPTVKRRERAGAMASAVHRGGGARAARHLSARAARDAERDRCARLQPARVHRVLRQSGNARRDRHDAAAFCSRARRSHRCSASRSRRCCSSSRFPGARLLTRFLELFVAFPSFLVAFTLIFLYGSQGSVSIGLQRLFHLRSAAARLPVRHRRRDSRGSRVLRAVRRAADARVVRDARHAADRSRAAASARTAGWSRSRSILPLAWPGIAAGTILCFLLTLNEFGILLVLGSAHLITLADRDLQFGHRRSRSADRGRRRGRDAG